MPFNLFRKKKETEQKTLAAPTRESPQQTPAQEAPTQTAPEAAPEPVVPEEEPTRGPATQPVEVVEEQPREPQPAVAAEEQPQETPVEEAPAPAPVQEPPQEQPAEQKPAPAEPGNKTYLKAMPLKELADIENVKNEVRNGNIIILRVTPLAGKSIEDVKTAVNELFAFAESIGGDIARLGEERVVVCPKTIRIWREKTPAPVSNNQPVPTVA
jgi:uncharacterized protein